MIYADFDFSTKPGSFPAERSQYNSISYFTSSFFQDYSVVIIPVDSPGVDFVMLVVV